MAYARSNKIAASYRKANVRALAAHVGATVRSRSGRGGWYDVTLRDGTRKSIQGAQYVLRMLLQSAERPQEGEPLRRRRRM